MNEIVVVVVHDLVHDHHFGQRFQREWDICTTHPSWVHNGYGVVHDVMHNNEHKRIVEFRNISVERKREDDPMRRQGGNDERIDRLLFHQFLE